MNSQPSDLIRDIDQTAVAREPSCRSAPATAVENEARRQLEMDFEALREREANLRRYEARLRGWQEQLDARTGNSGSPAGGAVFGGSQAAPATTDADLCTAWEKFHRARALLQAEQNQLRDDRMAQHDNLLEIKRRETELAAREKRLAERELLLTITVGTGHEKKEDSPSTLKRITQAPLLAAKAVFGSGK